MLTSIRSVNRLRGREFLEIDRRRDADREGQHERHQQRQERSDHGAQHAGLLRLARVAGGEEHAVEAPLDAVLGCERIEPAELQVRNDALVFRQVAVDLALDQLVDVVGREQPELAGLSDQARILEHQVPQVECRALADEAVELAQIPAAPRRPGTSSRTDCFRTPV